MKIADAKIILKLYLYRSTIGINDGLSNAEIKALQTVLFSKQVISQRTEIKPGIKAKQCKKCEIVFIPAHGKQLFCCPACKLKAFRQKNKPKFVMKYKKAR